MARHILLNHHNHTISVSNLGLGVGSLVLCVFALFMCASHSRRSPSSSWRKVRTFCYGPGHYDPVISDSTQEIPDGYDNFGDAPQDPRGVVTTTGSGDDQEGSAVWMKNILMGGKCQLPDFSGVIIYDSNGTIVPPTKTRLALTWK